MVVVKILSMKMRGEKRERKKFYIVKWDGDIANFWEQIAHLCYEDATDIILAFQETEKVCRHACLA